MLPDWIQDCKAKAAGMVIEGSTAEIDSEAAALWYEHGGDLVLKIEQFQAIVDKLKADLDIEGMRLGLPGANRLAYFCARAIQRGSLDSRSAISDALLDYLEIGGIDGPKDIPTWIAEYEAAEAATQS